MNDDIQETVDENSQYENCFHCEGRGFFESSEYIECLVKDDHVCTCDKCNGEGGCWRVVRYSCDYCHGIGRYEV